MKGWVDLVGLRDERGLEIVFLNLTSTKESLEVSEKTLQATAEGLVLKNGAADGAGLTNAFLSTGFAAGLPPERAEYLAGFREKARGIDTATRK